MELLFHGHTHQYKSKIIISVVMSGLLFILFLLSLCYLVHNDSFSSQKEKAYTNYSKPNSSHFNNRCKVEENMCRKVVAAYFSSETSRSSETLEEMNPKLITHLYYAFLEVQPDGTLEVQDSKRVISNNFPAKLKALKQLNPNLKLLFSCISQGNSFSVVVQNKEMRKKFIDSAVEIIQKWNFDGLDLDWEYPKANDKENFVLLLRELKDTFIKHNYLLTAAVRAIPIYHNSGYDVPRMFKYLDFINIMTYDYFGGWSIHTGFNSPLYPSALDSPYERQYLNVEASLKNWIDAGAPKNKICIGIPFYGRSFTLRNELGNGIHAPSSGAGKPAALTYYKIITQYNNWTTVWDDEQKGIYKFKGNQWIGYDDKRTIKAKVKFALEQDIAGVFVWHLGGDDITGETSGLSQFLLCHIYTQITTSDRKVKATKEPPAPEPMQSDEPMIVIDTDPSHFVGPLSEPPKQKLEESKPESTKADLEISSPITEETPTPKLEAQKNISPKKQKKSKKLISKPNLEVATISKFSDESQDESEPATPTVEKENVPIEK